MLRVLIWGESFSGYGHLEIVKQIAQAFKKKGHDVLVASGTAQNVPEYFRDIQLVPLPLVSIKLDHDAPVYVDEQGLAVSASDILQKRRDQLLHAFHDFHPDVIITEQWPHSRGLFDIELIPLLHAASRRKPSPLLVNVCTDVRSANSRYGLGGENDFVRNLTNIFDRVAVLSDEDILSFEKTQPSAHHYGTILHHVGFIGADVPSRQEMPDEMREILLSAGVAPFKEALQLFHASIDAWPHSKYNTQPWRIIVSHKFPEPDIQSLKSAALQKSGGKIVVETTRKDFFQVLSNCRVSISLGGYSTLMALIKLRVPSLVYAAQPEGYTDHSQRVEALAEKGLISVVTAGEISNSKLFASKIDEAAEQKHLLDNLIEQRALKGVYEGVDLLKLSPLQFTLAQASNELRQEFGYPPKKIKPRLNGAEQLVWLVEDTINIRKPYNYVGLCGITDDRWNMIRGLMSYEPN
jgi:predicted glycosyltransferase